MQSQSCRNSCRCGEFTLSCAASRAPGPGSAPGPGVLPLGSACCRGYIATIVLTTDRVESSVSKVGVPAQRAGSPGPPPASRRCHSVDPRLSCCCVACLGCQVGLRIIGGLTGASLGFGVMWSPVIANSPGALFGGCCCWRRHRHCRNRHRAQRSPLAGPVLWLQQLPQTPRGCRHTSCAAFSSASTAPS